MISIELHEKLMKKWARVQAHAGVYQKVKRRHRLEYFMKHVDKFKGMDVLEAGCNAGLYGYEISRVAKSYFGFDRDIGGYYTKQSAITKKYMENPNVTFMRGNTKDFIKKDIAGEIPFYNAFFASFVLYHMSGKETDRLAETVLPKCDIVIISTRTKKRTPFRNYNPHKFNKPKNVRAYLEKAGFKCEIQWPQDTKKVDKSKQKYAYVIGKREEKNVVVKNKKTPRRKVASTGTKTVKGGKVQSKNVQATTEKNSKV